MHTNHQPEMNHTIINEAIRRAKEARLRVEKRREEIKKQNKVHTTNITGRKETAKELTGSDNIKTIHLRGNTRVNETIAAAWVKSTKNKHRGGLKAYLDFCNKHKVPEQNRFPAEDQLRGIRAFHIQHNLTYKTSIRLKYTLIGLDKQAPLDSKQPECPPVTKEMLKLLHDKLNLQNTFDIAVYTLATMAFYAQIRLGELIPKKQNINAFDAKEQPTGHHLAPPHTTHGS
ncbi:uncharacterized protein EV420DRAFT_1486411 [Desarmillaria tabescens]|uniref:Uncharacterized protein n=1 Tax=Armillaria tabescens TaxID=1929756 RepID=A0AA39JES4_ARMTA|nr:uncharacterized protein EV420DRAFT_1486411 [Desarmillaria tabescens]KAK0439273.1 hypothetical protein EV420DRAFT_1486411 [Desarmillaria tabescens]